MMLCIFGCWITFLALILSLILGKFSKKVKSRTHNISTLKVIRKVLETEIEPHKFLGIVLQSLIFLFSAYLFQLLSDIETINKGGE